MRKAAWFAVTSIAWVAFAACSAFEETATTPTPVVPDGGAPDAARAADASEDGDPGSTCVADLSSDPRNCGACGHDCLAGTCAAGVCQPFVVASNVTEADQITLGETRVFWEEGTGGSHQIVACPRGGCDASGPSLVIGSLPDVKSIVTRLAAMYFTTYDSNTGANRLEACTFLACAGTRRTVEGPVISALGPFTPLRASADGVWWGRQVGTDGEIHRVDSASGSPEIAGKTQGGCLPARIARGVNDVLWTCLNSNAISQCAMPCTSPRSQDMGTSIDEIERGVGVIVWDDQAGQKLVAMTEAGSQTLPARGKGPIAIVGSSLIFHDSLAGEIATCTLPGCGSRTALAKSVGAVTSMAVDRDGVYWTDRAQGVVMGVAR